MTPCDVAACAPCFAARCRPDEASFAGATVTRRLSDCETGAGHAHIIRRILKIEVVSADARVSRAVRAMVVRRVQLALSRFGRRVQTVRVRVAETANPLGGTDRCCEIRAWLRPAGDVRAQAINGTTDFAVGRAAARLATDIAWVLDGSHATPGASPQGDVENREDRPPRPTAPGARKPTPRPRSSAPPRTRKASRVRSGGR